MLAARREDRIQALADELGNAIAVACDLTDAQQIGRVVAAGMRRFGRIDVLLNIAGQGLQSGIEEIKPEDFRAILDLNVVAPLRAMQAVLPLMRAQGGGSIVNVSSGITFSALPEICSPTSAPEAGYTVRTGRDRQRCSFAGDTISQKIRN